MAYLVILTINNCSNSNNSIIEYLNIQICIQDAFALPFLFFLLLLILLQQITTHAASSLQPLQLQSNCLWEEMFHRSVTKRSIMLIAYLLTLSDSLMSGFQGSGVWLWPCYNKLRLKWQKKKKVQTACWQTFTALIAEYKRVYWFSVTEFSSGSYC